MRRTIRREGEPVRRVRKEMGHVRVTALGR